MIAGLKVVTMLAETLTSLPKHQNGKHNFLKISIPVSEIDTDESRFYLIVAKGKFNDVDVGLKLFIDKSFEPIFGMKDDEIAITRDPIEQQIENGLIIWGGENILNNLINIMASEWGFALCPVSNDLNCDGQLLWGSLATLKFYKNSQNQ